MKKKKDKQPKSIMEIQEHEAFLMIGMVADFLDYAEENPNDWLLAFVEDSTLDECIQKKMHLKIYRHTGKGDFFTPNHLIEAAFKSAFFKDDAL